MCIFLLLLLFLSPVCTCIGSSTITVMLNNDVDLKAHNWKVVTVQCCVSEILGET